VRKAVAGVKRLAVIDRNLSPGTGGIFCQEIKAALQGHCDRLPVYGYVAGLGGEDITPELIEKAIRYTLENEVPADGIAWLGLDVEGDNELDRDAVKVW
jgi:pyruvate/2-oxoacid:ferredoxin oxidoreductase alpha subunit